MFDAGEVTRAVGAVVVTGASSGIGEACAVHLDRLGLRVFAGVLPAESAEGLQRWHPRG